MIQNATLQEAGIATTVGALDVIIFAASSAATEAVETQVVSIAMAAQATTPAQTATVDKAAAAGKATVVAQVPATTAQRPTTATVQAPTTTTVQAPTTTTIQAPTTTATVQAPVIATAAAVETVTEVAPVVTPAATGGGPGRGALDSSIAQGSVYQVVHGKTWKEDHASTLQEVNGRIPHKLWWVENAMGKQLTANDKDGARTMSRLDFFLLMFLPDQLQEIMRWKNVEMERKGKR